VVPAWRAPCQHVAYDKAARVKIDNSVTYIQMHSKVYAVFVHQPGALVRAEEGATIRVQNTDPKIAVLSFAILADLITNMGYLLELETSFLRVLNRIDRCVVEGKLGQILPNLLQAKLIKSKHEDQTVIRTAAAALSNTALGTTVATDSLLW
jgi:hypothetical protein